VALNSVIAVSVGAAAGALLRWWLAMMFNAVIPTMPLGTLSANLLGGLLMGVALGFFAQHTALPVQWKLLCVTGFLGGLTTFSSFSGEVTLLLRDNRMGWALMTVAAHLFGSLAMTAIGMVCYSALRR
jgi:CrcB protein